MLESGPNYHIVHIDSRDDVLFRIEGYTDFSVSRPQEFKILEETPRGYWVDYYFDRKFVLKTDKLSKKRLAYKTRVEALDNYKCRKRVEISMLKARLERAEEGLRIANTIIFEEKNEKETI